ncbi:putative transcriptional regulator, TetR family [Roseibium sp. TrichSKD4]|nr:putative transcriptional regulator, TetR family [Roseibium sp. TrichSKD4]
MAWREKNANTVSMRTEKESKGRRPDAELTDRILTTCLAHLAAGGLEGLSLARLAADIGTSKQALYRRFSSKEELARASLDAALTTFLPPTPERSNPARDLSRLLQAYRQNVFLNDPGRALLKIRHLPAFEPIALGLEQELQFHIRQILIATPFEADMAVRIELFIAFLWHQAQVSENDISGLSSAQKLDHAILTVLGLTA